jgi:hypothetical protein
MDEQVLALVIGRDKPEPLLVAEPFNGPSAISSLPGDCVLRNAGDAEGNRYERWHYFRRARSPTREHHTRRSIKTWGKTLAL